MKHKIALAIVAAAVLTLVFSLTDPNTVPAYVLIVPFAAIFILLATMILYVGARHGWTRTRRYRVAIVGAGVPVVLLVLQSIGQLTMRDLITIGAIFVILYFYLSRLSLKK